jgi:hypothetical protein
MCTTRFVTVSVLLLIVLGLAPSFVLAAPADGPATPPQRLALENLGAFDLNPGPQQPPQAGPGAIITVTTFDPNIAADGQCSLIEAIVNANDDAPTHADCPAGSGPDVIELSPGTYTLTQVYYVDFGANGLPAVTSVITINGHGATLTRSALPATPEFRFTQVPAGGYLTLNDLTLSNGKLANVYGGALYIPGGSATFNHCVFENNRAAFSGALSFGGLDGTLEINDSTFRHNTANISSGAMTLGGGTVVLNNSVIQENRAMTGLGGGIVNAGELATATLTLNNTRVISNTAGSGGGGICNAAYSGLTAILTINDSTIAGNQALYGGGVSLTVGSGPSPDVRGTINRSTISNNRALDLGGTGDSDGGGIDVTAATLTVANSTVSGNSIGASAFNGGGGIWVGGITGYPPAVLHIINSTVTNNTAAGVGGGISHWVQSGATSATTTAVNTIVAGNSAPAGGNCWIGPGSITSSGYNMENTDTCNFHQPSDHPNTDPLLGPLANNGGPTWTHALLPTSPAIDVADNATCAAPPVSGIDQRGVIRPQGLVCDIGAYETVSVPTAVTLAALQAGAAVPAWHWLVAFVLCGGLVLGAWRRGVRRS